MNGLPDPAGAGTADHATGANVDLLVIAKAPVPGRVKTRLTPPFTPQEAALLATAALLDTLAVGAATPAVRCTLVLDGAPGEWAAQDGSLPGGRPMRIVPQRGGGLDERLACAFEDAYAGRPMVLIGMDTPQVTPALLTSAAGAVARGHAAFGPAADGGFWLLGLPRPDASLLRGVPMSRPDTGRHQLARLTGSGLTVASLPMLTDVDTASDAAHVAAAVPYGRFARTLRRLERNRSGEAATETVAPPRGTVAAR